MLTWWDREVMNMLDSLVKKKVKAKLKERRIKWKNKKAEYQLIVYQ